MLTNKLIIILSIICLCLFIIYQISLNINGSEIEHFTDTEFINSDKLFDKFYTGIYDQLFYSGQRVEYEVNDLSLNIIKGKLKTEILDIGCGTGHHLKLLNEKYRVTGIDKSNEMLKKAKHENPNIRLVLGDANNKVLFGKGSFTIITCYFFTIYYFKDINHFLNNIHYWLKEKGIFAVHIVNKDKFDPLLDIASPFPAFSLQKYSKERVTKSNIHFNNFSYTGNFEKGKDYYKFVEIFKHKKKSMIRKQEHKLYMFKIETFIKLMNDHGFKEIGQTDLLLLGCEYQYIFYFRKR